jgi:hypothetical protein
MGLLRKAAGAVLVDDTDGAQRAAPAGQPGGRSARVGLLKRSMQVLAEPPAPRPEPSVHQLASSTPAPAPTRYAASPPPSPADRETVVRQIIEESKGLPDGVELPSRLFTTLRKRLSIAKGALLLYDPARLEYAPWASYGFDQTTLHRMRIPLGANDTFNALANGQPLLVTEPDHLAAFQRFFSSREFSLLERIYLSPYISDESLVGVLIATEMRHPSLDSAGLMSCLQGVAAEVSPLVQKARRFLMKLNQAKAARPPATPEEQVARLLESPAARGRKMLFLSLALGTYVRGIAAAHEDLDLFRLREDVRSLMDAFLADLGTAIMLPAGNLMVGLQDVSRDDIPLFLHQLRYFLDAHFAGALPPEEAPRIDVLKSRIWPDEGTEPGELVSFLSS